MSFVQHWTMAAKGRNAQYAKAGSAKKVDNEHLRL